ncbi:hypothetical protein BOTBODRAFT_425963 [Botryobasidium botryosum FD-172 SS1]|uniref:Uncharacterized protein n=1 Tax=Botryobasidium botryosum (strain FD-172 SS1) TaxID=930990 RepID=A0A067M8R4_BOTB1|nr:hypothetical protein BOTBODRAFT_425963 [Botryobasidium botryosum FD-172 SS1]
MDRSKLESLKRAELQRLAKEHNIKANLKTDTLVDLLLKAFADAGELSATVSHSANDEGTVVKEKETTKVAEPSHKEEEEEAALQEQGPKTRTRGKKPSTLGAGRLKAAVVPRKVSSRRSKKENLPEEDVAETKQEDAAPLEEVAHVAEEVANDVPISKEKDMQLGESSSQLPTLPASIVEAPIPAEVHEAQPATKIFSEEPPSPGKVVTSRPPTDNPTEGAVPEVSESISQALLAPQPQTAEPEVDVDRTLPPPSTPPAVVVEAPATPEANEAYPVLEMPSEAEVHDSPERPITSQVSIGTPRKSAIAQAAAQTPQEPQVDTTDRISTPISNSLPLPTSPTRAIETPASPRFAEHQSNAGSPSKAEGSSPRAPVTPRRSSRGSRKSAASGSATQTPLPSHLQTIDEDVPSPSTSSAAPKPHPMVSQLLGSKPKSWSLITPPSSQPLQTQMSEASLVRSGSDLAEVVDKSTADPPDSVSSLAGTSVVQTELFSTLDKRLDFTDATVETLRRDLATERARISKLNELLEESNRRADDLAKKLESNTQVLEGAVNSQKQQVTGLEEIVRLMKEQFARLESSGSNSSTTTIFNLARPSIPSGSAPSPAPSSLGKHNRPTSPALAGDDSSDEHDASKSKNKRARRVTDQSDRSISSAAEVDSSLVIESGDDEAADVPAPLPKPLFDADFFPPPPKNGPLTTLPFALVPSATPISRPQTGGPSTSGRVGRASTGAALRTGSTIKFSRKLGGGQSSGSVPTTSTLASTSSAPSSSFASLARAPSGGLPFSLAATPKAPSSFGFPARPANTSPASSFTWGQASSWGNASASQPEKAPEAEDSEDSEKK